MNSVSHHRLKRWGVLTFRGPDALRFLHSQLTADVAGLAQGEARPAAWCNPQGRVLAVLWLLRTADGALAVLPRELAPTVAEGLRRFVLRAKVAVADESGQLEVVGLAGDAAALPAAPAEVVVGRQSAGRALLVGPAAAIDAACAGIEAREDAWSALALSRGEPQVVPATSGEWIPQMLNLDLIGAVSFDKGCYPGQEIVARAHHLGRVKRRMARYTVVAGPLPGPGEALYLAGQKVAETVAAAPGDPAQVAAVVNLEALGQPLGDEGGALALEPAPLPYALPEAPSAG